MTGAPPSCPGNPPILQYDLISQYIPRGRAPFLLGSFSGMHIDPGVAPRVCANERQSIYPEGSSYSSGQCDSAKKCQSMRRREAAPLKVPGSRAKGLSWQNPAGSTHRGSPPPSHLVSCMAGGCHTLEVAVQRAHRWTRVYLFFWIPTDYPSGVRV